MNYKKVIIFLLLAPFFSGSEIDAGGKSKYLWPKITEKNLRPDTTKLIDHLMFVLIALDVRSKSLVYKAKKNKQTEKFLDILKTTLSINTTIDSQLKAETWHHLSMAYKIFMSIEHKKREALFASIAVFLNLWLDQCYKYTPESFINALLQHIKADFIKHPDLLSYFFSYQQKPKEDYPDDYPLLPASLLRPKSSPQRSSPYIPRPASPDARPAQQRPVQHRKYRERDVHMISRTDDQAPLPSTYVPLPASYRRD